MGVCMCKKSKKSQQNDIHQVGFPEIKYLDRISRNLLTLNPNEISKTSLKGKGGKIFKDAGIGLLLNSKIFLIGGSNKTGSLKNEVLLIDPLFESMKTLAEIPIAAKGGSVLEHEN